MSHQPVVGVHVVGRAHRVSAPGLFRFAAIRRFTAVVALALATTGQALAYPTKAIRIVVTAPPGGTIDYLVRALAPGLTKELGQSVVIDNKAGASGLLGADLVAKAVPDGYTVLLTDGAALAINAATRKDLPFDPQRDLVPVSLVATTPSILVAHPGFAASTLKELVVAAGRQPGAIGYATPGVGTPHHLAGALFSRMAGIELNHVPYKGGGPMVADVLGGQVPLLITGTLATLPHIKAGKLKPLAIGSPARNPLLPEVPTFAQSGYPDFESEVFFSFFVAVNTPAGVAPALLRALQKTLADPEVRKRLEEQALVVVGSDGEALRAHFRREMTKWGDVIRVSGIVLE